MIYLKLMDKIKKIKIKNKKDRKKKNKIKTKDKKENISLYTDVFIGPVG
jgi:hypothetical protein